MFRSLASMPRAVLRALHRLLGLHELSLDQFSTDTANRVRRSQIRGTIEQMRVFVVGNTVFAPVLSFQAWNTGINGVVALWTTLMLCFSWWLFFRWRQSYQTDGSETDMDRFVAETRVNASLWCLGLVLFYPVVAGDGKTILTTVMAGSLALGTVGFAQTPRAAMWYLGIQTSTLTAVPLVFGYFRGSPYDFVIGILALFAGLAIFNAALERARAQMRAFITHEELSQKSEVIDLLLKDYEKQGTDWVWRTGPDGKILSLPQPVHELITGSADGDIKANLYDIFATHTDPAGLADLAKVGYAFETQQEFHNVTLPFYSHAKGELRWIMVRGRPQFEGGEFIGFRGIFADSTTTVEAQKQVAFLAEHDPLTGTFNRNLVQSKLRKLDPKSDKIMAYLIDLDGFKLVNDSYGHTVGDQLLKLVARRLKDTVNEDDIVARLGGDEFLVLTSNSSKHEGLDENGLSFRLLSKLSEPYIVGQFDIALSASIGTANFPQDTQNGPHLLNQADLALYAAKENGRNRCVPFLASMQDGQQKRILVTERLRYAVQNKLIVPNYQPQYCSRTGTIIGFEALARWTDAELGVVGPDFFIPIAEETGLIHDIGKNLLLKACEDACGWQPQAGAPLPRVCVNVSPVQVMRGDVVGLVKDALAQSGLPPARLEIEVTEGGLINDMDSTHDTLSELAALGVGIALDDFGTGYSSLSYLPALPLHRLKIDRSFVANLANPEAYSVVQTIIDLCRRLRLSVVAEGVETAAQVKTLTEMQCDFLQGYYFSRPLGAADIQPLLDAQESHAA